MMINYVIDGQNSLGFDTGLNARAFAQAKLANFITETGFIVYPAPPSRVELWKASGVREISDSGRPTMVVLGPCIEGERLDTLFSENQEPDRVLAAVSLWIQAVLVLGKNASSGNNWPFIPLWPSAALIAQSVFFAPHSLARHGVTPSDAFYVNPALDGTASYGGMAAAFTAAAMLYRLFAGTPPFNAADTSVLHEDMRDGNFLPVHLAVPGLDSRLAALIHNALVQTAPERPGPERPGPEGPSGKALAVDGGLGEILEIIKPGGQNVSAASLVHRPAEQDRLLLEKEKAQFLRIKTRSIKTRRFIARNMALLLGSLAAAVAAVLIIYSVISTRLNLPTTEGMNPVQVMERYYHAFGDLDYQMMEACVTGDTGKQDIATVINLFVLNKTRQAYEYSAESFIYPAHLWHGGSLPDTPLFGVVDLNLTLLGGDESDGEIRYRADYTFWIPAQAADEEVISEDAISLSYPRRDYLTLVRKKGRWRIAEITR